eukprot:TRINITY_DN6692_c0_g1_i2.p2 TRINITY_DN6692_c0_g1~~TRINITY_DN6692_c0_g1_i2.p2  ORF type:complete len:172 (+),score=12.13 TRINITY_DN6692_c0_g1_i2:966-1481(+)
MSELMVVYVLELFKANRLPFLLPPRINGLIDWTKISWECLNLICRDNPDLMFLLNHSHKQRGSKPSERSCVALFKKHIENYVGLQCSEEANIGSNNQRADLLIKSDCGEKLLVEFLVGGTKKEQKEHIERVKEYSRKCGIPLSNCIFIHLYNGDVKLEKDEDITVIHFTPQ